MTISHKQLVRRMTLWLRGGSKYNCGIVLAELATQNSETPDVLGFHGPGLSVLIECKITRADFLADKKKQFRQFEEWGVGDTRYFATPKGLLSPDELPPGWGLLEIETPQNHSPDLRGQRVYETKKPERKKAAKQAEVKMLMSALRRLEISSAVFVQTIETPPPKAKPGPKEQPGE